MSPARILHLIPLVISLAAFYRFACSFFRIATGVLAGVFFLLFLVISPTPRMSEYKGLHRALLLPNARVSATVWSPFGYTCAVNSRHWRYAPGLSLQYTGAIPRQQAIFTDGNGVSAVCDASDPALLHDFFNASLDALPYRIVQNPRALIVRAGGGMSVLAALANGASHVDALESDRNIRRLMRGHLAEFSGHLYDRSNVTLRDQNLRVFSRWSRNRYDLIVLPIPPPPFASVSSAAAQDANFIFTEDAFRELLRRLHPGGALVVNAWLNIPPRDELKIFATAVAALRQEGVFWPERHIFFARSLRTCLLVVAPAPLTPAQIAAGRSFCEQHGFDRICHSGLTYREANRFNVIENNDHFSLCRDFIMERDDHVFDSHIFNVRPATDDQPFFFHFFRWAALPQLIGKTGQNVAAQIGWGYLFLLFTLGLAVPTGALLAFAPLAKARHRMYETIPEQIHMHSRFVAIAFGFMFLEMAALQQFMRFIESPAHAFAAGLGLILFASGLGAWTASRDPTPYAVPVVLLCFFAVWHVVFWQWSLRSDHPGVFFASLATLAEVAFFMGMPFPAAIRALKWEAPSLVPWAWGVNGFASVLAILLAALLSVSIGITALCALAIAAYLVSLYFVPK